MVQRTLPRAQVRETDCIDTSAHSGSVAGLIGVDRILPVRAAHGAIGASCIR